MQELIKLRIPYRLMFVGSLPSTRTFSAIPEMDESKCFAVGHALAQIANSRLFSATLSSRILGATQEIIQLIWCNMVESS